MITSEIARVDWPKALEAFSAVHEGWLVSLDILSADLGAQPEVSDLPLVGITFEPEGRGVITIAAASSAVDQVTHSVHAPTRIWIERTDAGADAALQVESVDGVRAILRFKTVVLPETVDGVARWP